MLFCDLICPDGVLSPALDHENLYLGIPSPKLKYLWKELENNGAVHSTVNREISCLRILKFVIFVHKYFRIPANFPKIYGTGIFPVHVLNFLKPGGDYWLSVDA